MEKLSCGSTSCRDPSGGVAGPSLGMPSGASSPGSGAKAGGVRSVALGGDRWDLQEGTREARTCGRSARTDSLSWS